MIVLIARYQAAPGNGDAVETALQEMAPLVEQHEPGCLLYHACRSTENSDVFVLYEQYEDQAALDRHRETSHFQRIIEGRIVPLLDSREREMLELVAG